MTQTTEPAWFVVSSGEHAGRVHLKGWNLTAIRVTDSGTTDGAWLAYAVCPRCHAMVLADDRHPYGDRTWAHERWHAATDYPIPAALLDDAGVSR